MPIQAMCPRPPHSTHTRHVPHTPSTTTPSPRLSSRWRACRGWRAPRGASRASCRCCRGPGGGGARVQARGKLAARQAATQARHRQRSACGFWRRPASLPLDPFLSPSATHHNQVSDGTEHADRQHKLVRLPRLERVGRGVAEEGLSGRPHVAWGGGAVEGCRAVNACVREVGMRFTVKKCAR